MPAGTSLVEASDGGTQVGNEVIWDLGTLNPGDSDKRRVTVQLGGSVDNGDLIEVDAAEISGTSNFETQRTRQQATTRVETASQLAFSIDMPAQPLRNTFRRRSMSRSPTAVPRCRTACARSCFFRRVWIWMSEGLLFG